MKTRMIAKLVCVMILWEMMAAGAAAKAQGEYPQPRESYVNDYAGLLTAAHAEKIRTLFKALKEQTGIEATVVTVHSFRDYGKRDASFEAFATNLFNAWEIGDKAKNNGVMLIVASKDRAVRLELGAGYGQEYNAAAQQIVDEDMIPHFKAGDYSRGIYEGARAVVARVSDIPAVQRQPNPAERLDQSAARPVPQAPLAGQARAVRDQNSPSDRWSLIAFGAFAIVAGGIAWRSYARHHKRRCPNCKMRMEHLDEVSDDLYLDSGQKAEELLNSVNYHVWKCPSCNAHEIHSYGAWLSSFKRCPKCNYRTLKVTSEVINEANYSSPGRKSIKSQCNHCDYRNEETIITPRLKRPDREASGGSRSFSSRSSGGNRSFGGGRSSGGGAGGRW